MTTALPATVHDQLTPDERAALEMHERVIGRSFVAAGESLRAIRDGRLYRSSYATFEDYCRERWEYSDRHARRLIDGAEVVERIGPIGPIPTAESQVRPLTRLPAEEQPEAWREAVQAAGGTVPTQAQVERVVALRRAGDEQEPEYAPVEPRREPVEAPAAASAQKLAPMMSSASPEWYTPDHIIERVFAVLEDIDLDPCADPDLSIAAGQHFTAETDGLAHEWRGRVYMNPPYGDGIGVWVRKLITEFEVGNTTEAIALVPARIDTQWWKPLASRFVWCGIEGRLRFSGSQDSAPFPSALFYLGGRPERFAREFADLGLVYDRFGR